MIEKLIELQNKAHSHFASTCVGHGCDNCAYGSYDDCAERIKAEYLIANGVTVQKWIPVTEQLPEPMVCVLCWYEYFRFGSYNRMFQTYGIGHYFRDGMWGGEVSNGQKARVLAWMPLPEPPKVDGDSK